LRVTCRRLARDQAGGAAASAWLGFWDAHNNHACRGEREKAKDFGADDLMDFWRLEQSGLFYQRTTMRTGYDPGCRRDPFRCCEVYTTPGL